MFSWLRPWVNALVLPDAHAFLMAGPRRFKLYSKTSHSMSTTTWPHSSLNTTIDTHAKTTQQSSSSPSAQSCEKVGLVLWQTQPAALMNRSSTRPARTAGVCNASFLVLVDSVGKFEAWQRLMTAPTLWNLRLNIIIRDEEFLHFSDWWRHSSASKDRLVCERPSEVRAMVCLLWRTTVLCFIMDVCSICADVDVVDGQTDLLTIW